MNKQALSSFLLFSIILLTTSCGVKIKLTEAAKLTAAGSTSGGTGGGIISLGVPQLVTVADPSIPVRPALNTQFIDVSADGRFLVFDAGDVVGSSPTGGRRRVFYTDMQTAQTHLVSQTTDPADVEDCDSTDATISSDGSTIAFVTCSSNLELSSGSVTPGIPTLVIMDRASGELEAVANHVSTGNTYQSISISGDGDRIAFVANTDLVAADTNGTSDAYVFERGVGLRLVSQSSAGVISNGWSSMVNISDDGNHVIFSSAGTNLDPSVTLFQGNSGVPQPYVHNLLTGETQKISAPLLTSADAHSPSISADGQFVAFISSSNEFRSGFNYQDSDTVNKVYVRDLDTGQVELVSTNASRDPADGTSDKAFISANGRFVIFSSVGSNLVADDVNGQSDVFIKDLQTQQVSLVSINESGQQMDQAIFSVATEDAKFILFSSLVSNPISPQNPNIPVDDQFNIAIDVHDVFVRNRDSGTTTRVSLADDESLGNGNSFGLSISRDGRYVLFISSSTNLLSHPHNPGNHIFMRDTFLGTTTLVSEKNGGGYPWGGSESGSMSGDASVIAFASGAGDIVADDSNGFKDIFIKRFGMTYRIMGLFGSEPNNDSSNPTVSSDGFKVLFRSLATNLIPNDFNNSEDWFIYDVQSGIVSLASTDQLGYQLFGVDSNSKAAISADGRSIVYDHTISNTGVRQLYWKSISSTHQPGDLANVIPVSETKIKADIAQNVTKLRITNGGEYAFIETEASNIVQGSNFQGGSDVFRFDLRKKYYQLLLHSFDAHNTDNSNLIHGSVLGDVSADGKKYQISSLKVPPFDRSETLNFHPSYVVTEGVSGDRTFDVINVDQSSNRIDLNPQSLVMDTSLNSYFLAPTLIPGVTNDFGYLLYMKSPSGVSAIDLSAPQYESANSSAFGIGLSPDGGQVTFTSGATSLHPLSNTQLQVYLRNMGSTQVDLVSQNNGAAAGSGASGSVFSRDGKTLAFSSQSSNILSGGTNGQMQVFLKDLENSVTQLVSVNSSGAQGNGQSFSPSLDSSGKVIVFLSYATNIVAGDTNSQIDIFLRNLEVNSTSLVSVSSSGVQANGYSSNPDVSADGRFVVFDSYASNLVASDTNGRSDIFLRDTQLNTTTIVSIDSSGNLGNGHSFSPKISADGRFILFLSQASNLVSDDTNGAQDIFVHDRLSGQTSLVSVGDEDQLSNSASTMADFSGDGRYVVFFSGATNLISDSVLPSGQVYVRDRQTNKTHVVSKGIGNSYAKGVSQVAISEDGSAVSFVADYLDVGKVIGVGPQIFWRRIR